MFFLAIGVLAAACATVYVVCKFWDQIKSFLTKAMNKVKELMGPALKGVATYLKNRYWEHRSHAVSLREGFKTFAKHYSMNKAGNWVETTVTKVIPPDEIPEHVLKKLSSSTSTEVNITKELADVLELKY